MVLTETDPMLGTGRPAPDGADEFEALLRLADARLRRYARGIVGPSSVDDVLQDAYVRAFRSYDRFRGDAQFTTWMFRIVHNTCLNHLRRVRPFDELDDETTSGADVGPTDGVIERIDFERAFDTLPRPQREAVMLVLLEGYTYDIAAEILGTRRGTVASRVNRGRKALLNSLTQKGEA